MREIQEEVSINAEDEWFIIDKCGILKGDNSIIHCYRFYMPDFTWLEIKPRKEETQRVFKGILANMYHNLSLPNLRILVPLMLYPTDRPWTITDLGSIDKNPYDMKVEF